jgi:hypothetical protein
MTTKTTELMIPSLVASVFLILTALDKAEVTMIASAVMLLSLLLVDKQIRTASVWPKIVAVLCAVAIAVAAVLLIRR